MGADIHIDRNFEPLDQMELVTPADMRDVGLQAREIILRRTIAGMDAQGAAFAPYSEGYAKQKRAALGTADPVNLQVSGNMLNDLTVTEIGAEGPDKPFVKLGWNQ